MSIRIRSRKKKARKRNFWMKEQRCWYWVSVLIQITIVIWFIIIFFRMKHFEAMALTCKNLCHENFERLQKINGKVGNSMAPNITST